MFDVVFDNLNYGHLFWLVAVLAGLLIYVRLSQTAAMQRFADRQVLRRLMPNFSVARHWLKMSMLLLGLVALTLAAMDIRWGRQWKQVQQKGVDVMFVLDVSRSMLAQDTTPSRLKRAKQMIRDTVASMDGDRVGLVAFAGDAQLAIPLTSSYADFLEQLDYVNIASSKRGGSVLGNAIQQGVESFPAKLTDHKAMIIISDGEDQESDPVKAATEAYEERGIRIYTIGLGDENKGAEIPIGNIHGRERFVMKNGERVITRMNGEVLDDVAAAGGGVYLAAGTQQVDMMQVYDNLVSVVPEKGSYETRVRAYKPRYMWFVGLAIFCFMAEMLISSFSATRGRQALPSAGEEVSA